MRYYHIQSDESIKDFKDDTILVTTTHKDLSSYSTFKLSLLPIWESTPNHEAFKISVDSAGDIVWPTPTPAAKRKGAYYPPPTDIASAVRIIAPWDSLANFPNEELLIGRSHKDLAGYAKEFIARQPAVGKSDIRVKVNSAGMLDDLNPPTPAAQIKLPYIGVGERVKDFPNQSAAISPVHSDLANFQHTAVRNLPYAFGYNTAKEIEIDSAGDIVWPTLATPGVPPKLPPLPYICDDENIDDYRSATFAVNETHPDLAQYIQQAINSLPISQEYEDAVEIELDSAGQIIWPTIKVKYYPNVTTTQPTPSLQPRVGGIFPMCDDWENEANHINELITAEDKKDDATADIPWKPAKISWSNNKCECGGDKLAELKGIDTKQANHAVWCQKWQDPTVPDPKLIGSLIDT